MTLTLPLSGPLLPHLLNGNLDRMTAPSPPHTHTHSLWNSFQDSKFPVNFCLLSAQPFYGLLTHIPSQTREAPLPADLLSLRDCFPLALVWEGGNTGKGRKYLPHARPDLRTSASCTSPNPPNPHPKKLGRSRSRTHSGLLTPEPVLSPLPLGYLLRSTQLKWDRVLWPGGVS